MAEQVELITWLREQCAQYRFDLGGAYRRQGAHGWPLVAADESDLESQLQAGGHLLGLPKEPAALANILEVSLVDFLGERLALVPGAEVRRGTERGYPDLEVSGPVFGGGFHAIDIKIAKRGMTKKGPSKNTQSRVTLYTGNTYFKYPQLHWPGTFRPFQDYSTHLDVIGVYTLDPQSLGRVADLELIVQPPWKIASTQRSSTTREYIGGVVEIAALREGRGEFDSPEAFYSYWRKFNFKIGKAVAKQLEKLLTQPQPPPGTLQEPPPELPL